MTESRKPLLHRFVDFLIRHCFVLLTVVVVSLGLAWPVASRLEFDQSIESLYAKENRHLANYKESKRLFGGDEFVFVAYVDPHLFQADSLELSTESAKRLRNLARELNQVSGVKRESTQNLADTMSFPHRRRRVRDLVTGILVGSDHKTTAVVLRLLGEEETKLIGDPQRLIRSSDQNGDGRLSSAEALHTDLKPVFDRLLIYGDKNKDGTLDVSELGQLRRAQTIKNIRRIAEKNDLAISVAGEPVQIHDMFRYVEEDGSLLFGVSLGLLSLVVFTLFFNVRWVLLPLLVVLASIVWTETILVLSRMQLSMVSSMLNSLVTIVGVATVTHVTVHFREKRRTLDRVEALRQTLVELLPAIFWTCATTAAGFLALLSSHITPVRSFGMMISLGTLLVLVAAVGVLPGGILLGRLSADPGDAPAEKHLTGMLRGISHWIEYRPRLLAGIAVVIVVLAAFGFLRLKVETDFSKNFRASSPIVQSIAFVEDNLGGAGTWEINFPAPNKLTDEYLGRVRRVAEELRNMNARGREAAENEAAGLTKVLCITDGLDLVPEEIKLPLVGVVPFSIKRRLKLLNRFQPEFESTLYNAEEGRMRIVLRSRERQQASDKRRLIESVELLAKKEFPQAKTTGLFVLLAFLIESLLDDQLVSFALAVAGIGSMMTIAFRSLRIGLISLVPNLFPIVIVIGGMGWIGLPINIATAMIASVSMGLTVDSSIHYISGYRRARSRGLGVSESLRDTHQGVGRALVFANLALIVGFSVLTLSHFIPLVYFGILVSVAMLGGLVGNLVLLPLLLQWVEGSETAAPSADE